MSDDIFLEQFEDCSLSTDEFHHDNHVRLAWLYLRTHSLLVAMGKFSTGLRRYATSKGAASKYHETITWAYLLLIHDRMLRCPDVSEFSSFRELNRDLFSWNPSILDSLYTKELLSSDLARTHYVLPDKLSASLHGDYGRAGATIA